MAFITQAAQKSFHSKPVANLAHLSYLLHHDPHLPTPPPAQIYSVLARVSPTLGLWHFFFFKADVFWISAEV